MHSVQHSGQGDITAVVPIKSRRAAVRNRERGGRFSEVQTVGSFYLNNPHYEIGVVTTEGVANITIEGAGLFALARKAAANKSKKSRVGPITVKFVGVRDFHAGEVL